MIIPFVGGWKVGREMEARHTRDRPNAEGDAHGALSGGLTLIMNELSSVSAETRAFVLSLPFLEIAQYLDKPTEMLHLIRACEDPSTNRRAFSMLELHFQACGARV